VVSEFYGPHKARSSEAAYTAVAQELAQEKAAALGRAGRRLEAALEALASSRADDTGGDPPEALLDDAGEALLFYVVQREACGLTDMADLLRRMRVPREVQLRMRIRSRTPG
jgi:hypothetical protein